MIFEFLGRYYGEALRRARQYGVAPERILVTCPPWPCLAVGELRVVGIRPSEFGNVWILAYPEYVRIDDGKKRMKKMR